jgi:hypothetical protein
MNWIEPDRIIEGVFMSGLFSSNDVKKIVRWANLGEPIPVTCRKCKAVFITKNINYIGFDKIHFGDDFEKCMLCNHSPRYLRPDGKKYKTGQWY